MGQNGEPSVEEILESIKKVIARDNRTSALEARRRREFSGTSGAAMLGADDANADGAARPHTVRDEAEILDLVDMEVSPEPEANMALEDETGDDDTSEDAPLITQAVREAMQENLAALAMMAEPGARPQIVRSGETSLEGLTRELLRPMLAEWLDAHLPAMVERMVQTEIARIVGKKI